MPELPEVETTLRGIRDFVQNKVISEVVVREYRLRYPIVDSLPKNLVGRKIQLLERRGKYLLFACYLSKKKALSAQQPNMGYLLFHLGMSGSLSIQKKTDEIKKHDHVDLVFNARTVLRYHDPRRFGALLWIEGDPYQHPLLAKLGPEPLSDEFHAQYLYDKSRKRSVVIKNFIMNSHIVVGVGNIYANEALFLAGINPTIEAGAVSLSKYDKLVRSIKKVLAAAIKQGGTTLKDFVGGDGKPGYFKQSLNVYGRGGLPCNVCKRPLKEIVVGQRATVYCSHCQR